jgi:hypothetical protein
MVAVHSSAAELPTLVPFRGGLRLSQVLATAERQSRLRGGLPMVVVSDGLRFATVALRTWRIFGKNFAPSFTGEMLVRYRDGITTVAVYSENMVQLWSEL